MFCVNSYNLSRMIPISEAISIIIRETPLLAPETVDLTNSIGRILAEDIFADSDLPPFDRSQMDGFAVKSEDVQNVPTKLKIVGESVAGKRWQGELKSGEAVRIMTGAALPIGADSVQKVEVTKESDGFIKILEPTKAGQFFVKKATEITKGTKVFEKGEVITKKMIATLASFGYAKIKVSQRPTISILATGSELVSINEIPNEDGIRDSNSATIKAFAEKFAKIENVELIKDDLETLKSKIKNQKSKITILTGGVSMGDYDFTKPALRELGAEIFFEKVCLKPGKPCVFAKLGEQLIFGLPGNPVSVITTFSLFVRTAILQMQSAKENQLKRGFAILSNSMKGAKERDSYLPATLEIDEKAQLIATPLRFSGSSDFVGFAKADCLIFVPKGEILEAESVAQIVFI
ncbi:MAG: molybdopterin molybdotransferase MoeA [Pyrinomonadaceae bacterium]|nr:molybdopterin molybdotransferase MoeA [Pyrinomonadaceae bacterium]